MREVETELAIGDVKVSNNLRWIAHGPHPVVTTYNSYAINGCHYHTKTHDKNKIVQNSGVSLVAKKMQVCSSKDKNPIIGEMSFYCVIEEIWELNYNSFKIAIFKCDWVEKSGGIKTDELGFVLVDLSRVGHKNDSFIFATQAKQVFFVEDPSDSRWSVVLTPPQREFTDQYNDDELGDTILNCQGMPKATIDIESRLDLDENITLSGAFVVDVQSKKAIMRTTGVSFCQFNSWLTTQYIIPFMDEPQLLIDPPSLYAHIIDKPVWQEFVRSRMSLEFQILDKAPNEESPNDALTQALGTPKYGGQEKVLENVVKEKKGIAASVPPVSLTSKKKVVEEEEMKEEEVIATRSMTKNKVNVKVKASRPMTKEVEVTSEPSNLPIQLKYILRYAERVMVDGSSFSFQLPLELFGIPRNSYILQEDVIDFCNMQKVKTLSMVAYIMYLYSFIIDLKKVLKYVFVDQSLISAGHSTREIRARNLCSRLMTSKQDQLVIAPYNPGDHWSLVIINPYDNVVYHLNSLRTSSRDDIKYCPLQVGTVEYGYYVMRYMREIVSKDTSIITDAIDTRNSYSQLELDEVRVEWLNFYSGTYHRYT
ncbi:hypothetical protein IC582_003376 [Cucumis melo]